MQGRWDADGQDELTASHITCVVSLSLLFRGVWPYTGMLIADVDIKSVSICDMKFIPSVSFNIKI